MKKNPHSTKISRETGFLLDTNVWRYVADDGAWPELLRIVHAGRVRVLVAPSVIYEALRTGNPVVRRQLTWVMSLSSWRRLMPEAFSESQELLSEIRRLRPGWLRPAPDKDMLVRQRYDWTRPRGGFWDRVRNGHIAMSERGVLDRARDEAQQRRQEFQHASRSEDVPLDMVRRRPLHWLPGWKGDDVEDWRWQAWFSTTYALEQTGHPYIEWLDPEIDLTQVLLDETSWLQFWLYEVAPRAMPRFWLRWAFEFLQRFRRVTDGTPCDSQLATYLPEADVVVSADKAFIQIAGKCAPLAPCRLPTPVLVPAGSAGVDALVQQLSAY